MPGVITPEKWWRACAMRSDFHPGTTTGTSSSCSARLWLRTDSAAVAATKAVCLEIAEDEAERCRSVGATAAQQTALTIAARIRKRHVEVRS